MTARILAIQPPRFARTDLGVHIPFIQVRHSLFVYAFCVVIEGKVRATLFRKIAWWPNRHSLKRMQDLGHRLDRLLETTYQRGLDLGMHADYRLTKPAVHRDGDKPIFVHLFPFCFRRLRKNLWRIAYGGWVADLKLRKSGIELEELGWCEPVDLRPEVDESPVIERAAA